MNDLNKRTEFDKKWEEAFQHAEMTPPDSVWSKIDSALSKEEAGYFKKRAFMFKLLAAASITFALGMGAFSLNYYLKNGDNVEVARTGENTPIENEKSRLDVTEGNYQTQDEDNSERESSVGSKSNFADNQVVREGAPSQIKTEEGAVTPNEQFANNGQTGDTDPEYSAIVASSSTNEQSVDVGESNDVEGSQHLVELGEMTALGINPAETDDMLYQIDHIYMIPFMPKGASKIRRESDAGALMASLDFSAGSFDPNFQQGATNLVSGDALSVSDAGTELAAFNTTNKSVLSLRSSGQETKPEITYSYGANMGFRLTRRFLIQTGFAYRKANTTTTTSGFIENLESNTRVPIVASYQYQYDQLGPLNHLNITEKTDLNNQYEFAAIPVRAGYIVLDRKINVTLLAGVSSEFFINNRIVDESGFLETLSSSDREDSPYRTVYFNGSLGTQLGYTFARNYMVTLEPSYRMAISSFTKDSFYLNSFPSSFMVSFGVAYNFR